MKLKTLIIILLIPSISYAFSLAWEQPQPMDNLKGWVLQASGSSGGEYADLAEIEYDGTEKASYTLSLDPADFDPSIKHFFVVRAVAKDGRRTDASNEAVLMAMPGVPVELIIKWDNN